MYFSRIELNRSGASVAQLLKRMSADDYYHHQFVWQLFKGVEERDFLYRREDAGNWPRYYTVSARQPCNCDDLWSVETKPYAPKIYSGLRLAFSLRVNPVVTRKTDNGKRARHDVVMDRKRQLSFKTLSKDDRPALQEVIRDAGLTWLKQRATKHGFVFEEGVMTIDGYEQHKCVKRNGNRPISFSTLDLGGMLIVTDKHAFEKTLFSGIGPAKGMGCGMLLVRRV